jgi:putative heme iron utilization protein
MPASPEGRTEPASICRNLIRQSATAALATIERGGGAPYASLVQVAAAHDASPLLLISDLADHTKNIAGDGRVSLLFDGTRGLDNPLTGARVSIQGSVAALGDTEPEQRLKRRYVARHPETAGYAGFADFRFYSMRPERFHLVAGFGRISWLDAAAVLLDAAQTGALEEAEDGILAHMNADHGDAIDRYAQRIVPDAPTGWRLTGIDPEGADMRREGAVLRLDFQVMVSDGKSARHELVRLAKNLPRGVGPG